MLIITVTMSTLLVAVVQAQSDGRNKISVMFTSPNAYVATLMFYTESIELESSSKWNYIIGQHYDVSGEALNSKKPSLRGFTQFNKIYSEPQRIIVAWIAEANLSSSRPKTIEWSLGVSNESLLRGFTLINVTFPPLYVPITPFNSSLHIIIPRENLSVVSLTTNMSFIQPAGYSLKMQRGVVLPAIKVVEAMPPTINVTFIKLAEEAITLNATVKFSAPIQTMEAKKVKIEAGILRSASLTFPVKGSGHVSLDLTLDYVFVGEKISNSFSFFGETPPYTPPPLLHASISPVEVELEEGKSASLIFKMINVGDSIARSIDLEPEIPPNITITYGAPPKSALAVNESATIPLEITPQAEGTYNIRLKVTYQDIYGNVYHEVTNRVRVKVTQKFRVPKLPVPANILTFTIPLVAAIAIILLARRGKKKLG